MIDYRAGRVGQGEGLGWGCVICAAETCPELVSVRNVVVEKRTTTDMVPEKNRML